ncbi:ImuA family protein [Erythrobacter sp. YT30]|uniref:ImuA family protein n=1 Tax=Erythrobacter sp. YT30 TaxID=1735012 RepID=UPI000B15B98C|nr:recA-like protein [Erythrobacter sp. YT30]
MTQSTHSSGANALQASPVPQRPAGADNAACLSAKDIEALSKQREARWRPGLADQPLHSEIFAATGNASGAGVALALAKDFLQSVRPEDDPLAESDDRRKILWVQETRAIERGGRPYLHGLPPEWQDRLIHAEAKTAQDALFALEEGLKCRDLACVIGEIVGNPRELDFTASRRLSLTAERHGVPLWLVRLDAQADLSSARMRWRVEGAPSLRPRWNSEAPGEPQWQTELFRARAHAPGKWMLTHDNKTLIARKPGASDKNLKGGLGTALARHHRLKRRADTAAKTPDSRHMVRATVGRSLAACARM